MRQPAGAVCTQRELGSIPSASCIFAKVESMNNILRWAVPLAFLMHGLEMIGGVYFIFTGQGWLAKLLGGSALTAARAATAAVWIVSGVAFVTAAWGFWKNLDWWRTAAWLAAPTTLVGVGLAAGAVPPGTYVGAAMAIAVVVALALGW